MEATTLVSQPKTIVSQPKLSLTQWSKILAVATVSSLSNQPESILPLCFTREPPLSLLSFSSSVYSAPTYIKILIIASLLSDTTLTLYYYVTRTSSSLCCLLLLLLLLLVSVRLCDDSLPRCSPPACSGYFFPLLLLRLVQEQNHPQK